VSELLEPIPVHGPAVALVLDSPAAHLGFRFGGEVEARVWT